MSQLRTNSRVLAVFLTFFARANSQVHLGALWRTWPASVIPLLTSGLMLVSTPKRSLRSLFSFALVCAVFLTEASTGVAQRSTTDKKYSRKHAGARVVSEGEPEEGLEYDEMAINKAREEYFRNLSTSGDIKDYREVRRIGYEAMRAKENPAAYKTQAAMAAWQPIAGSQENGTSGRLRGMAFDSTNPNIIYVAAAQGGVWKTTNALADEVFWTPITDGIGTLAMGDVAVDPKNPNVVYAGTGEVAWSFDAVGGNGFHKSTDGGLNWERIATTQVMGSTCSRIAIDPQNTSRIFVATGNTTGGLRFSDDAGATWKKLAGGLPANFDAYDIVIDPQDPQKMYSSGYKTTGDLYRSVDGGTTWTKCTLPPLRVSKVHTALSIAPSSPNYIYGSTCGNSTDSSAGIIRSTDYGVTWTLQNPCNVDPKETGETNARVNFLKNQGPYDNAITVNPTNPETIIVGGIQLYYSKNGGTSLTRLSVLFPHSPANPGWVHADCHGLAFRGGLLYAITDGGIYVNSTGTNTNGWKSSLNKHLSTLQFVDADADRNFGYVIGGTQDNSVNRANLGDQTFTITRSGDAGDIWVSQVDAANVYSTYVQATFFVSTDSGKTFGDNQIRNTAFLNDKNVPFYPTFEASVDGTNIAFGVGNGIYFSDNAAADGFPRKTTVSGLVTAIAIHEDNPDKMWFGTNGKIYYSTDKGATVKAVTVTGGQVREIVTVPGDEQTLYAVVGGVSANNNTKFLKSVDGGLTWQSNIAQDLPTIDAQSLARNSSTGHLFMGTMFGVLYSTNDGVNWQPLNNGLPLLQVNALKVRGSNNQYLLAGTYGRGLFYMNLNGVGSVGPVQASNANISLDAVYPNPVTQRSTTSLNFSLKKAGETIITLHDVLGREIRTLAKAYYEPGTHTASLNTSDLAPGTYYYALMSGGERVTQKLVIAR